MTATARVTAKGQITIPIEVRRELGIEKGDSVVFYKGLDGSMHMRVRRVRKGAGRGSLSRPDAPRSPEEVRMAIEATLIEKHSGPRNGGERSRS